MWLFNVHNIDAFSVSISYFVKSTWILFFYKVSVMGDFSLNFEKTMLHYILISHLLNQLIVKLLCRFCSYHNAIFSLLRDRVAQWVRSLDLTTHTSLSPIRRGFALGFVNYKKGALDSQPQVIVYQLLAQGRWFSPGTPASSTTKTDRHDIAEILQKVALNTKIKIQILFLVRFYPREQICNPAISFL